MIKSRVLILDDEQIRLDFFRSKYENQTTEVTTVTSYQTCVLALEKFSPWDLIHLDHDLGEQEYYYDSFDRKRFYTGLDVVHYIIALPPHLYPKQIVIHSVNPTGANYMLKDLQHYCYQIPVLCQPFRT